MKSLVELPSQGQGGGRLLKISYFLENYIENSDWQCHNIQHGCLFVCCTQRDRKNLPYKELVGTTKCITL
jgi:hypothetical protein